MNADSNSSAKVLAPHFSKPEPTRVIPAELQPNQYRATERLSHEATELIPSGGGAWDMTLFLPSSKEKHERAWEGSGNCLWRLCRRIRAIHDLSDTQAAQEADSVFELWYASYREWCKNVGVSAEPKSRLHGEFVAALDKCKLPEGETLVAYAFKRAMELPFPSETAPFDDDQGMCMLASTLRECALFNDEGGLCYASTRDIEKYTQLCNKDTAARWLKQLEKRNILLRIHNGVVSVTNGIAPRFIYLPLVDVEKMSPENRNLYDRALAERVRQAAPTKTRTDLI
jgi:hypothetical protein